MDIKKLRQIVMLYTLIVNPSPCELTLFAHENFLDRVNCICVPN